MIRKIALMTGGGDCAGINAFIATAVRRGIEGYGSEFIGIRKAFEGACSDNIDNYIIPFKTKDVIGLESKPSTILASSRFNPFSTDNIRKGYPEKILYNFKKLGIDAVLATGGNDTIKSVRGLSELGIPAIAAPKSIDNDVSGTDIMLGFKTAVEFGTKAFRSTVESARTHRRISLVEIMGREAGWLTLDIGAAGGADIILIPEKEISLEKLCQRIKGLYHKQKYVNIAVAEGINFIHNDQVFYQAKEEIPVVKALAEEDLGVDNHGNQKLGGMGQILRRIIKFQLGLDKLEDIRSTDLGFSLRGLIPSSEDIILGTRFGFSAVDNLFSENYGIMVGIQNNNIVTVPFTEALIQKTVDWSDRDLENVGVFIN